MESFRLVVLVLGFTSSLGQDLNNKSFPNDFMWGVGTSAYQIEGGWDADGKGENIWDNYVHKNSSYISDGSTGDIACDSYNKLEEDVQMLVDLGVDFYRFSISWSRVLPGGFSNNINEAGIQYYLNLITALQNNNITPVVTMFHWDLPQPIQLAGGLTNEHIVDWFADYARVLFTYYGEYVKYWMTFNEPRNTCQEGYGNAYFPPALLSNGVGEYICAHNVLKAHAKVWHIYDKEFRSTQNGSVGIVLDSPWMEPYSNTTANQNASRTLLAFAFGWFAHPLFYGDYPEEFKSNIDRRSADGNFSRSRLPEFTRREKRFLKGTVDILGVNVYTTYQVQYYPTPVKYIGFYYDMEAILSQSSEWLMSASSWLKITPWAMKNLLTWINQTYGGPTLFVTENGFSDNDTLEDDGRISYHQKYLSSLRDVMEDGVRVIGYTAWSLMDNFEWRAGYTQKFGLYHVDFDNENRTRTPKKSAEYYKNVTSTNCIVDSCVD